jgi:hypothetical protein
MGSRFRLDVVENCLLSLPRIEPPILRPSSALLHRLRLVLKFAKGCPRSMRPHSIVTQRHRKSCRKIHILTVIPPSDAIGRWTDTHKITLLSSYLLYHPLFASSISWNEFFSFCVDMVSLTRHQVKWLHHWNCSRPALAISQLPDRSAYFVSQWRRADGEIMVQEKYLNSV